MNRTDSYVAEPNRGIFWPVLLLTALAGFLIRLYVGRKTFISFDEWQHVFMAGSARWADLSFELRTNAHPPLFFLLLGMVVKLGNVALYRSISIASGVGSVIVVGLIARKILNSPVLQLLCAAAFALSVDAIGISVEIRSYQLAVFLTLLAFLSWLGMFPAPDGRIAVQPCVGFAVFSSLAVSSHYFVAFFLGASLLVSLHWVRTAKVKSLGLAAAAVACPSAVFAVGYFVHASVQPIQGYLANFYFGGTPGTPNESLTSFTVRNSLNFFNLFSPIEIRNTAVFLIVLVLFSVVATYVFFNRLGTRQAAAILFAAIMCIELLGASLARKYPFGGLLRHQYIAGPFLLIAAFVLVDALCSLAGSTMRRVIIPVLVLVGIVANLIVEGPKLILYPGMLLLSGEYSAFRAAFPDARAVYLDHWAVIGYFIHTSDRPRVFVRRISDDAVIDEYQVPGGNPAGTEIFYDKSRDSLNLSDASVYRSLAACLRGAGVNELNLFFYSPGDEPINQEPARLEAMIVRRAAEQGLATSKVVVGKTFVAAGFRLGQ